MDSTVPLTRQEALITWRQFLRRVPAYAGTRNTVCSGHENVSCLSAAIRFRTLLEDEIIADTLAEHPLESGEKWLQEVCWRRYWKGWLESRPQVWRHWRERVRCMQQELPSKTRDRVEAVMSGESGVACMDAIARELVETGYLHNHARMWWASFWIHVERLPWELGADFFFRHLLDADPASNTLSWRWVAGLQTPGKSYLVRLSNLEKYGAGYLAGNASGSERLADAVVSAARLVETADLSKHALPECPTGFDQGSLRIGVWLHPDDLSPENGSLGGLAPVAVVACSSTPIYREQYRLSAARIESIKTVLRDGVERATRHYGCPGSMLDADDPAFALSRWAKENAIDRVVAFAPTVGPTADLLARLRKQLHEHGMGLALIRRPSDAKAFSLVSAGFFSFWEKMKEHLRSDGSR